MHLIIYENGSLSASQVELLEDFAKTHGYKCYALDSENFDESTLNSLQNKFKVSKPVIIGHETVLIDNFFLRPEEVRPDVLYKQLVLFPEVYQKIQGRVIGINGVDTSGKSIFTQSFSDFLRKLGKHVQVIHMDDFHNKRQVRYQLEDSIMSYYLHAFDYESLIDNLLKPIKTTLPLTKTIKHLNLETDRLENEKTYHVSEDSLILVEGVLLFRPELTDYFDYKIFLDISWDEVERRAIKRDFHVFGQDVLKRYQTKYIPIQQKYLKDNHVLNQVDMVIDNNDFNKPKISFYKKTALDLVPLSQEDMTFINGIDDPEAKTMLGLSGPSGLEDYEMAFVILVGEKKVGLIELFNISWKNARAEMSIMLHKDLRNKGYGSKAIHKLLVIGFKQLHLNRIYLRVLEDNIKAIKAYEKVGFITEGVLRQESIRAGKKKSQIIMSILSEAFDC